MTQNAYGIALALIGLMSGGGVTWFVARRKTSGRIGTSDADRLWDENTKIRDYLTRQVDTLQKDVARLQVSAAKLEDKVEELERANGVLLAENHALRGNPS